MLSKKQIPPVQRIEDWFSAQGWTPFEFQREVWQAYLNGENGLIHAATGMGKTYAAYFGPIIEGLSESNLKADGLRILWITPLRALAADTVQSLQEPLESLGLNWMVEARTGDSSAATKARQRKRLPQVFVTTPESLTLILTREDAKDWFESLQCIIIDEWHELLASKRGVMTELALARLRKWKPNLRTWALSATLGNLDLALSVLLGNQQSNQGKIVRGYRPKTIQIDSIIPEQMDRFPWAGHLGLTLLPQVLEVLNQSESTLLFTNTRAQTEIWYQAILQAKPEWAGLIALHHGSLEKKTRDWVEDGLRAGKLKCVVCTSSLDLGVDFSPVDRVLQVGSPKGVARLLQRAGRSGHSPGRISRVTCVPTNAFELLEVASAKAAAEAGKIESRLPYEKPLDVLTQHTVSMALGGGFDSEPCAVRRAARQ